MTSRAPLRSAALLGAGALLLAAAAYGLSSNVDDGDALRKERATTRFSIASSVSVRGPALDIDVETSAKPVPVGVTHDWIVRVASAEGVPLTDCDVHFDGTMPEHGHGLPTAPRATGQVGPGRYRVEGVRFSMPGFWRLDVSATCGRALQRTSVDLRL